MRAEWLAKHRSLLRKKTLDTLETKVWFEMQAEGGQWAILKHLHKSTMTFKPVEASEEIQAGWGIRQNSQGLSASFYIILREGVWRPWMRKKGSKINRAGSWIPEDFKTMIKGKCKWGTCPQKVRRKKKLSGGKQVLEEVFQVLQGIQSHTRKAHWCHRQDTGKA